MIKTVILRITAVFGSSALAAIAGGSVMHISVAKSAGMAGFMAASGTLERILRAWYEDGVLTKDELNKAVGGK